MEIEQQDVLSRVEDIQDTISDMQRTVNIEMVSLFRAFKILVEHHDTIHKDCELLGDL